MKIFKRIVLAIIILIIVVAGGVYLWIKSTAPDYSGKLHLKGLEQETSVVYDKFGVPHVYAQNAHDAYFAFGYAHAQDRLFQMVMMRRLMQGRLSEILGKELLKTDEYMRTLSINKMAKTSAERFMKEADLPVKKEVEAYVAGINSFIQNGTLPIEFTMLHFKPEKFTVQDVFGIIGYMSLTFTSALSEDPMVTKMYDKLGPKYMKDLGIDTANYKAFPEQAMLSKVFQDIRSTQQRIPVPVWEGSNNWVVNGSHSKSGKVLLANDTHIQYSQPSVWYEAYIQYPGYDMYGYYLAGVPFALVGHNDFYAWGLTIFPFDNMNLYAETTDSAHSNQYFYKGQWVNDSIDHQMIPVKGQDSVPFDVRYTVHGPIMNPVYKEVTDKPNTPVSLWWAPLHLKTTSLEALYYLNNATGLESFEKAMSLIDVVGLNVVYGDKDGNIGWWATGKIPQLPPYVHTHMILDGASGKDDVLGFYPFDKNPQAVNPPSGILNTSNNAPPPVDGIVYPGYYFEGYRARRVRSMLDSQPKWTIDEMKRIQLDTHSNRDMRLVQLILNNIGQFDAQSKFVQALQNWDGNYDTASVGGTIYTQLLYFVLRDAMEDEVGDQMFQKLCGSMLLKNNIEKLMDDKDSPWWDNVNTKAVETRSDIFRQAFAETQTALKNQLGDDVATWKWGKVHKVVYVNPLGRKPPLDKIFNVGPFPIQGSNEVVDKEAFAYNARGTYAVTSGPALRFLIDLSDMDHALTIIPTGQSGNVMSPHYADQALMYVQGKYRTQIIQKSELKNGTVLKMFPEK
ncbi:MAG: penicillin acylase family protein [Bacteroidales bacterium]|nr:penicillin acylase family protein [Bacteroidales bacterium]